MRALLLGVLLATQSSTLPIARPHRASPTESESESRSARKGAPLVGDQSAEARIATYTGWLTFATIALASIAVWQALQLRATVKRMEQEFTATHRPKLVLRRMFYVDAAHAAPNAPQISTEIANIGESDALIFHFSGAAGQTSKGRLLALEFLAALEKPHTKNVRVVSGGSAKIIDDAPQEFLTAITDPDVLNGTEKVYFGGYAAYEDEYGNRRRFGFLCYYEPYSGRFVRTNDPDFQYED